MTYEVEDVQWSPRSPSGDFATVSPTEVIPRATWIEQGLIQETERRRISPRRSFEASPVRWHDRPRRG